MNIGSVYTQPPIMDINEEPVMSVYSGGKVCSLGSPGCVFFDF